MAVAVALWATHRSRFAMRSVRCDSNKYSLRAARRAAATVAAAAFTARSVGFPLLYLSRAPQRATRFRPRVLAVLDDLHAVHEHMFHTGRVLMRFFEGGVICDRRRIEHHHVGEHSFLEKSAVIETEICRR